MDGRWSPAILQSLLLSPKRGAYRAVSCEDDEEANLIPGRFYGTAPVLDHNNPFVES